MPVSIGQAKASAICGRAELKIAWGATQIDSGVLTGASSGYYQSREPWWGIV
jgi:hypothetical protein